MKILYVEEIPFKYKMYHKNKGITLSDKLKGRFDQYYSMIKNSNDLDIDEWAKMAADIKFAVKDEIDQSGNKKSIYVEDYVQFIFGVSYLLFDKYHLSQGMVSGILRITPNKYSKLDIFPYRSYQAYTKLSKKESRKSLVPNDGESIGIRIAECINKKVQAVYVCSAFVGVTNDLDVFANISTTDNKKFIMTIPSGYEDAQQIRLEQNMGYARFLFATSNNLENVQGEYKSGKVKEKIIDLLKMRDNSVLCQSDRLELFLDEGSDYEKYVRGSKEEFNFDLLEYRVYKRALLEMENGINELPDIEADEQYAEYLDVSESGIEYTEANRNGIYAWLGQNVEKKKSALLKKMSYAIPRKFEAKDFKDYLLCLFATLNKNFEINSVDTIPVVNDLNQDKKIRYAAIYWMLEVFGVKCVETLQVQVQNAEEYSHST